MTTMPLHILEDMTATLLAWAQDSEILDVFEQAFALPFADVVPLVAQADRRATAALAELMRLTNPEIGFPASSALAYQHSVKQQAEAGFFTRTAALLRELLE